MIEFAHTDMSATRIYVCYSKLELNFEFSGMLHTRYPDSDGIWCSFPTASVRMVPLL